MLWLIEHEPGDKQSVRRNNPQSLSWYKEENSRGGVSQIDNVHRRVDPIVRLDMLQLIDFSFPFAAVGGGGLGQPPQMKRKLLTHASSINKDSYRLSTRIVPYYYKNQIKVNISTG